MSAIFVLSTGRCGTQWLAENLSNSLPPEWRVEHEPLHLDYAPLKNSPAEPVSCNEELLKAHLLSIQKHLDDGGHYIECGFPCWRHLDWFRQALSCDVKVIHLHRDPISTARSWLKQNAFVPPWLPHLPVKELFHPGAPGALLPEYQLTWAGLTPFEKNLCYWAEVQRQADAYKRDWNPHHWLTLPFDCLFDFETFKQLECFLEVKFSSGVFSLEKKDNYAGMAQAPVDETLLENHPLILQTAAMLDYR